MPNFAFLSKSLSIRMVQNGLIKVRSDLFVLYTKKHKKSVLSLTFNGKICWNNHLALVKTALLKTKVIKLKWWCVGVYQPPVSVFAEVYPSGSYKGRINTFSSSVDTEDPLSPFVEQSETLLDVQVVQLVVIIHQSGFNLLPAPQNQTHPVSPHHVELVIWETTNKLPRYQVTGGTNTINCYRDGILVSLDSDTGIKCMLILTAVEARWHIAALHGHFSWICSIKYSLAVTP